jgi:hypothetical protein
MFLLGIYFIFSTTLNAVTGINICIPCIWKTLFGFHCPGCGLTAAFISLLKIDFSQAFEKNRLIFIVLPFGVYYLMTDYKQFKKRRMNMIEPCKQPKEIRTIN